MTWIYQMSIRQRYGKANVSGIDIVISPNLLMYLHVWGRGAAFSFIMLPGFSYAYEARTMEFLCGRIHV